MIIDMIIHCNVAYVNKGKIIKGRRASIINYA